MALPDVSESPLQNLISLRGRVAVVTGAARGIGAAIARRLGEAGARLVAADRQTDVLAESVGALTRAGVEASIAELDVADPGAVEALAERSRTRDSNDYVRRSSFKVDEMKVTRLRRA